MDDACCFTGSLGSPLIAQETFAGRLLLHCFLLRLGQWDTRDAISGERLPAPFTASSLGQLSAGTQATTRDIRRTPVASLALWKQLSAGTRETSAERSASLVPCVAPFVRIVSARPGGIWRTPVPLRVLWGNISVCQATQGIRRTPVASSVLWVGGEDFPACRDTRYEENTFCSSGLLLGIDGSPLRNTSQKVIWTMPATLFGSSFGSASLLCRPTLGIWKSGTESQDGASRGYQYAAAMSAAQITRNQGPNIDTEPNFSAVKLRQTSTNSHNTSHDILRLQQLLSYIQRGIPGQRRVISSSRRRIMTQASSDEYVSNHTFQH